MTTDKVQKEIGDVDEQLDEIIDDTYVQDPASEIDLTDSNLLAGDVDVPTEPNPLVDESAPDETITLGLDQPLDGFPTAEHDPVFEPDAVFDDEPVLDDDSYEESSERDPHEQDVSAQDSSEYDPHEDSYEHEADLEDESASGAKAGAEPEAIPDDYILEMRQVAGLTAGSMMKLSLGRAFEFSESNEGGSFSLRAMENGEVVVHPGTATTVVDEVEVAEPTLIGDAILNVSSACFSVRRPRPAASNESRMELVNATFAAAPVIDVPVLGSEEPLAPDQLAGSRLGALLSRNPLTQGAVGQAAWNFLQTIRDTRSVVAERHRLLHPDPEELKTRLSRLDPGLWERGRDHQLFGRFSVAYATIPWEPRFDNPELIPEILHEPIVEMSLLPWVPVTANLLYGPLAIVGRRAARLAASRHAILSLASLSVPGDVRISIRADRTKSDSWNWCRALPPMMATDSDDDGFEVAIVDGTDNLEDAVAYLAATSLDDGLLLEDATETDTLELPEVQRPASSMILLADSIEEIDHPCGTVLQIHPEGTASITNHLNETIQVTPIGVTEAFAHDMATRVSDILTDSFL